jgi:hypothetical protein
LTLHSKGVRVVGHSDIDKRSGNLIMAWADHCAYVAGGVQMTPGGPALGQSIGPTSGVAVIDVRNPAAPKVTRYLQEKGALAAGETMHAVTNSRRAVLAASTYGGVPGMGGPKEGWLDVYDVSDIIHQFTGDGGIQVMDISDLSKPRFVGKFAATRPDGSHFEFAPHEVSISDDERRIYAGVIASKGNDLNEGIKISPPNAAGLGPDAGGIYILDNSDIVDGRSDPKMRLVGTSQHGGWHSAVRANINGVPHIVGAGELGACPASWPRISNIADEQHPRIVGQFQLQMNLKENCPPRTAQVQATGGILGAPGTASTHFNDVDSATKTKLGLFPFMYAMWRRPGIYGSHACRVASM